MFAWVVRGNRFNGAGLEVVEVVRQSHVDHDHLTPHVAAQARHLPLGLDVILMEDSEHVHDNIQAHHNNLSRVSSEVDKKPSLPQGLLTRILRSVTRTDLWTSQSRQKVV